MSLAIFSQLKQNNSQFQNLLTLLELACMYRFPYHTCSYSPLWR